MKPLSGLDATFLYLETPETPMHVGSLHLYELPAGFKGSFTAAVRKHIASRMHLAPIFTRRLAFMPFDLGHPVWVEAPSIDIQHHIRKVPGKGFTVAQVEAGAAKLHGELIDRAFPLWEFHIFENVKAPDGMDAKGKLVGFYSKIHHAALDGKGGTVLANAILDLGPVPREVAPAQESRKKPKDDLRIGEMIGAVFSNSLAQYAKLARSLPGAASSLGSAAKNALTSGKATSKAASAMHLAPRTLFNVGIGNERSFATASVPFAEAKSLAATAGGTFNDIVLWLCSTALREYLMAHDALPRKSLVAAMPVSLREESNKELNNQASITAVDLGTQLADPARRMLAIMTSTGKVKQALSNLKSVIPTDYPSLLSPWLVGGAGKALFRTYGRAGITERMPAIANVAISNVPGPQVPLYLAGARMLTFHPLSIVLHGMALNITIQTYAGRVDFGLIGGKSAVPDIERIARAIESAFQQARQVFARVPATIKSTTPTVPIKPIKTRPANTRKTAPARGTRVASKGRVASASR